MNDKAELIRKRYLYRRLILSGDVRISREAAKKMVGPDCTYHLYGKTTCLPQEGQGRSCIQSRDLKEKRLKA